MLANVELALTLSGISKTERRRRATEALEKVGLGDQLNKKPNQMSGGQMQRVAIARAIVNDPDILLADEPTGALDTVTSLQIMEILKEIAKDKLVIMVTHNPDLAEHYSSRIVKLLDGQIIGDSNPFTAPESKEEVVRKTSVKKGKKSSMSFGTAFSLSLNNLMTKKGRTFMTSFAGSIGIIGIALILALSSGINSYIAMVQEDTLSTYPLTIQEQTQDMSAMFGAMTEVRESLEEDRDPNKIYVDDSLGTMMSAMSATVSNNLEKFKAHIEEHYDELSPHLSAIQYTYDFDLQVFTADGKTQVSPTTIFENMGSAFSGMTELMNASGMGSMMGVMSEMIDNPKLLEQQYDVIAGDWPQEANEIVLVVSSDNQISKMALYMLGILDQSELEDIMNALMTDGEYDTTPIDPFEFEDFLGMSFHLLNTSDFYEEKGDAYTYTVDGKTYPVWQDIRKNVLAYDQASFVTEHGIELKISGIVRPAEGATATSISTNIGYTKGLTDLILDMNAESDVIAQQKETPLHNVLTGLKFERTTYTKENINELIDTIDDTTMETLYAYMTGMILEQFEKAPPVNKDSFVGFAAIMNDQELGALIGSMMQTVATNDPTGGMMLPGLFAQLSANELFSTMAADGIDVNENTILKLLPILSMDQKVTVVMGLSAVCGEDAMTDIYDFMNESIMNMTVNEDNFVQLLQMMDDEQFGQLQDMLYDLAPQTDATLDSNLKLLGDAESAKPSSINFYAKDFESKDAIEQFISDYNDNAEETDKLKYTDMVGILMSSVTTIVNAISYVLIAFVSISLVVSSIMIGIITYISVLERTKEIGILRAMGASKRDISRVFNAETLIIGLAAGVIGILVTVILCFPINAIIRFLTGIPTLTAAVPFVAALILVAISTVLTIVAGLIPAKGASKKDPVVALRTE